jgi:hypothetical protein
MVMVTARMCKNLTIRYHFMPPPVAQNCANSFPAG